MRARIHAKHFPTIIISIIEIIRPYNFSMTYPQSGFKVEGDRFVLSEIGSIRIRLHRPIGGDVKTLTVKRMPSGRWYAVFCCEVEAQPGERLGEEVGVDLGLECFAALSDGTRRARLSLCPIECMCVLSVGWCWTGI